MMHIDDALLMAYADGELDAAAGAEVAAALATDPDLRARLEAHRRLSAAVAGAYGPVADEPVPERLSAMVRRGGAVVSFADAKAQRSGPTAPRGRHPWAAIAATLVVGVLAGRLIDIGSPAPIAAKNGALVVQGELAQALETQPSGAGSVGLTFRSQAGDYCRTFSADRLAGLACREDGHWTVQMAMTAGSDVTGNYRLAASDMPPEVLRLAETMIDGEPLDAGSEAVARSNGWKR